MNNQQTALITGATSGIGYELAKLFAKDGYRLVLVARDQGKLEQIAREFKQNHDVFVKIISADLSKSKAVREVFESIETAKIEIDVLVNNAGFGGYGKFWERELKEELTMIDLNVKALVALTHHFIPGMIQKGSGKILQVASTAGFLSGPLMANYYATKNYVLSFSEALAEELKGTGVTVTTLCPGPTDTNFADRAGADHASIFKGNLLSPAEVAHIGYDSMLEDKGVVIAGSSKWLIGLSRLVPRTLMTKMVKKFQESKGK